MPTLTLPIDTASLPSDRRYVEIHEPDLHIEAEGTTEAIARRLIEVAAELYQGAR